MTLCAIVCNPIATMSLKTSLFRRSRHVLMGLKIRVSLVRFRPWPPLFSLDSQYLQFGRQPVAPIITSARASHARPPRRCRFRPGR